MPLEYEPYHLKGSVVRVVKYLPDFVTGTKHSPIVFETKGYWIPKKRKELLTIMESNPHVIIIMVFQQDNKLNKTSKTRFRKSDQIRIRLGRVRPCVSNLPNDPLLKHPMKNLANRFRVSLRVSGDVGNKRR